MLEPARQPLILPGGREVSRDQSRQVKRFLKEPGVRRLQCGQKDHRKNGPIRQAHAAFPQSAQSLNMQLKSGELLVRLDILVTGPARYFSRKSRGRGLLVPANLFQI